MVELRGICKYFPSNGVTALENAGFTLNAGEIHALLGENGTGKSTLMHILGGYLGASSGSIIIDGKEQKFSAPAAALAMGIGMVRQHPGFIKGFKVWEDCILGAEGYKPGQNTAGGLSHKGLLRENFPLFLKSSLSRKRVKELIDQWDFDLSPDKTTESLTVSQRQKAAVLVLLLRDVKWFIFDEPTAVLTPGETGNLFKLFRRLRGEGKGLVLITHKLEEALEIADRVTVMRHGKTAESRNTKDLTIDSLKKIIFGPGEYTPGPSEGTIPNIAVHESLAAVFTGSAPSGREEPVLEIKDLRLELPGFPHIRNVNFRVMPGKILGITGTRDSGLETLELMVAGLLELPDKSPARGSNTLGGSITLNGRSIMGRGVQAFREAGGAYLGADRLGINLAPDFPISESLVIHAFRRARRCFGIFLDMGYLNSWCRKIMNRAGISRPISDRAVSFSGGMLQRILLAREFAENASLVILAEAGSGLDELNRIKLVKELKEQVRRGAYVFRNHGQKKPDSAAAFETATFETAAPRTACASALLFSTDMDELISVADEIKVLRNGSLTALENNERGS